MMKIMVPMTKTKFPETFFGDRWQNKVTDDQKSPDRWQKIVIDDLTQNPDEVKNY